MELIRRSLVAMRRLAVGRPAWLVVVAALFVLPVWVATVGLIGLIYELVARGDDVRVRRNAVAVPASPRLRWGTASLVWLVAVALAGTTSPPPASPAARPASALAGNPTPATDVAASATQRPTPATNPTPTAPATFGPAPTPKPTPEPTRGPTGATVMATVVRVIDGDTIEVAIDGSTARVRYIGIDTPETVDPRSPVEWMGPEASAANRALVEGRDIVLEKDVSETDRFGRLLRDVWINNGGAWQLVNELLVAQGFAAVSTYPPDVKYVDRLRDAEQGARDQVLGLWGPERTPKPTPKPSGQCHPSYKGACLKIGAGDYDCLGGSGNGPNYVAGPVEVVGPDEFELDRDNDGVGC